MLHFNDKSEATHTKSSRPTIDIINCLIINDNMRRLIISLSSILAILTRGDGRSFSKKQIFVRDEEEGASNISEAKKLHEPTGDLVSNSKRTKKEAQPVSKEKSKSW